MEIDEEIFDWQVKYSTHDVQYLDSKGKGAPTLHLLIVSNLNGKLVNLYRMKNYIREHPRFIDYAVCLGNMGHLTAEDKKSPEKQAKVEGEISTILDYIENLGCKILYIPADKDPDSLYENTEDKRPKLTVNSHNIHKSTYKLAEGLVICGIGGSVCESLTRLEDCSNYSSPGYFTNSLRSVVQNAGMLYEKSQFIVASYISPSRPGLVPVAMEANSSAEYLQVLADTRSITPVIAIMHGNTEYGKSLVNTQEWAMMNPGNLAEGNFAVMELVRAKGCWHPASTEFINLI